MYVPKSFEPPDTHTLLQFIHAHSFGVLVTMTSQGLDGHHIPFVFERRARAVRHAAVSRRAGESNLA